MRSDDSATGRIRVRTGIDVASYMRRIAYSGPWEATAETLRSVHRCHLENVPFENADVVAGRRLSYDIDRLFEKIVVRRRGGWCLETNWLLGHALGLLGYPVTVIGAGVAADNGFKNDLSHLLLLARIGEKRYFADVGFGWGAYAEPLPAAPGVHAQGENTYRVTEERPYLVVSRLIDGVWEPLYRCHPTPRHIADFTPTTEFHELSVKSPFNGELVCSRLTPRGWAMLSGTRLRLLQAGRRWTIELSRPWHRTAVEEWILRDAPEPKEILDDCPITL